MVDRWRVWRTAWDAWRAGRGTAAAILARQDRRLADILAFAGARSAFYRKLYGAPGSGALDLRDVPPVSKPQLMANFDEWVTDAAVARAGVAAFVADKRLVGQLFLDRYAVWTSSGTDGDPVTLVVDQGALAVYWAVTGLRGALTWLGPRHLWAIRRRGGWRTALIVAAGEHSIASGLRAFQRRLRPRSSDDSRIFSVTMPLADLVRALNEFRPTILFGYPTMITLLAEEQVAGRLRIDPVLVGTGAEPLTPAARTQISGSFRCLLRAGYGAAEFMRIALECEREWLHVNADWLILEPVDRGYRPVPAGEPSHTVLLTNLANRVQPLIRYDLGDSVTVKPDPCTCGSPLPAIRVEGRHSEILSFPGPGGERRIAPLALVTVVEATAGVSRVQIIQTGPAVLTVRLEAVPGADSQEVRDRVGCRLREYLSGQGLSRVNVEQSPDPPRRDPVSGKFRQVSSETAARPSARDLPTLRADGVV